MMKSRIKKISFPMLLAVFLVFTLCACGTEKQTDGNIPTITYEKVKDASVSDVTNFNYEIIDDKVIINSYSGTNEIVHIPDIIDNSPVVEIAASAFIDNNTLKGIIIPDNIEIIGTSAFKNCTSLEIFISGIGLKKINESAFYGCTALREVELLSGVEEIRDSAFIGTSSLDNIYIPDTVSIIHNAFSDNTILIVENESYAQQYARDNMFNFEVL